MACPGTFTDSKHPNYRCLEPGHEDIDENYDTDHYGGDDDDSDQTVVTLGVDGEIYDKVDGAVENEEEV